MSTQDSSVEITGAGSATATSGQQGFLLPELVVTSGDGSPVSATLLLPASEGTLSIADLPANLAATLIQRPDVSTSAILMTGTAAEVQAALSEVMLTPTSGLTASSSGSYQLILSNDAQRSFVTGSLTVAPAPVVVAPPASAAPAFVQTGSGYVVGSDASQTAVIDAGTAASTVTGGAASLDFTGGNATLFLGDTGSTTVHSEGGNTVWVGAAPLSYVSGGNSTLEIGSGSIDISGGAATDSNMIVLAANGTGTVDVTTSGPSGTVLFGGPSALHYTGGNATLVLNGAGMTGSAVVDSTGGNTVWAGAGDLTYNAGGSSSLILSDGATTVTGGAAGSATTISMGSGTLAYDGGAGTATVQGGAGMASILGGSGALSVAGGNSVVTLTTGDATVGGGAAGTDNVVYNGSGHLLFQGAAGAAVVTGGTGSDTVHAGSGGGWFGAGTGGNSTLQAGGGATFLQGAANGDVLIGAAGGATWMQAGAGNETLLGGNSSGTVTMQLGTGSDHVVLSTGDSAITTGSGTATISGGGGTDLLSIAAGGGATLFSSGRTDHATIDGFRFGTDHLALSGTSVTGLVHLRSGTVIDLSGGGSISLNAVHVTNTDGLFG